MKKLAYALIAMLGLVSMTSCSQISTPPDMIALHYGGGPFESHHFKACVPVSTRQNMNSMGDSYYLYPNNSRTFDATGGRNSDANAITVVSKDSAEMSVPVVVQFDMVSTCQELRRFHELIGNRYHAYWSPGMDSSQDPAGWVHLLDIVIGKPLEITLDRVAQNFTWRQMYSDPTVRQTMQNEVEKALPDLAKVRQGGYDFFSGWNILVQKPDVTDPDLKKAIAAAQNAVANAQANQAKAEADKAAAWAQVSVAQAEAAKRRAEISGYGGLEGYLKAMCIQNGCNPFQPSYGQPTAQTNK